MTRQAAAVKRQEIIDLVRANPGIHKSLICRQLELSWGTATHHVQQLEKQGILRSYTSGRELRLFYFDVPPQQLTWIAQLQNDVKAAIVELLQESPSLGAAELSEALGISAKVIRRHLTSLVDTGLVVSKAGGTKSFRLDASRGTLGEQVAGTEAQRLRLALVRSNS